MRRGLLLHIPTQNELERLYWELARLGAPAVGAKKTWPYRVTDKESVIALASEMLRYDARLLTILVRYFTKHWRTLNPLRLRNMMHKLRWPQALCVVLAFTRLDNTDSELRYFSEYICSGWSKVSPYEMFFINTFRPASRTAQRRLGWNIRPYAQWGFIGTERPVVDAVSKRTSGHYDSRTRQDIVQSLAARLNEFTLAEYMDAVDNTISRQQALADLKASKILKLVGRGRASRWLAR